MITYEVQHSDPLGDNVTIISDYLDIEWARSQNQVGSLTLTLPYAYNPALFVRDSRLAVFRSIDGGAATLDGETIYFVRQRGVRLTEQGEYQRFIRAFDTMYLLDGRVVDYVSGSSQASKGPAAADDVIKDVILENLGSSAGVTTGRDLSAYITIEADLSGGASIQKAFAWRDVLTVCQELASASYDAGTWVGFDLVATAIDSTLTFRTWTTQRGTDRRYPGSAALILAPEFGNLAPVELLEDWSEEVTAVTAGGQGEGTARVVARSEDATRITESPFGRRERFYNASQSAVSTTVQDDADAQVSLGVKRTSFQGDVQETSAIVFGRDYQYGDLVTAAFDGQLVDCRIDGYRTRISSGQVSRGVVLRSI